VTFRSRVIAATVLAAAVAVVLACSGAYVTTSHSLMRAVDESLNQAYLSIHQSPGNPDEESQTAGAYFEIVSPTGQTSRTSAVPIDATIKAVAAGTLPRTLRTVTIGSLSYRELINPIPAGSFVACETGLCQLTTPAAELFVVNVTGQQVELRRLADNLIAVALLGLVLAFGGGLLLARRALQPLGEVTDTIESIATTNDFEQRLDAEGGDELGRLRRVFNELLESVESSQYLQRQLVMDASHELRTPLTSLRTNAQLLSRAAELEPEDVRQITNDMVTQVDELAALVTDLGELARGERSEGDVEPLRLDELVDEQVETARTYARLKNITIEATASPTVVNGRRDRLVRAVSNLLTNAIKFTPADGQIRVTVAGGVVTVSDSGPGVAPADRDHVFDRFWRAASARSLPGSGLGLSIVAQVAAEFDGSVRVDADPALGGARFVLSLPEASER
jgi:two-component system sensor histidine kinase MprB